MRTVIYAILFSLGTVLGVVLLSLAIVFFTTGCDQVSNEPATPVRRTAMIYLDGNLIAEGEVESYTRSSYGVGILIIDGKKYETHYSNCVVITDISKGE